MTTLASFARVAGLAIAAVALIRATWSLRGDGPFPIARLVRRELQPSEGTGVAVPVAVAAGILMVIGPAAWTVVTAGGAFAVRPEWRTTSVAAIAATVVVKLLFVSFEELAFRAALISSLRRSIGVGAAVVVSAIAFAAAHGRDAVSTAVLVADGIGFGAVYIATRSLRAPIAWHAAKNLAVWLVFGESTIQFAPGLLRLTPTDASATAVPSDMVTLVGTVLQVSLVGVWLWASWIGRHPGRTIGGPLHL